MSIKRNSDSGNEEFIPQQIPAKLLWVPLVIAIFTYIVFYPSLGCGFVNWDDPAMVTENHLVVNHQLQLKEIFTKPVAHLYHPLTTLSLALNYQAGKLDPSGYHSWNVFLHIFNTLFVFIFIYMLSRGKIYVAAIVSLLFGIHPMHVESVTWVTERKDLLFMFFFLPGLISYLYYRKAGRPYWYLLTMLFFVLSLLSKAHAVVFPLILLLIDYFIYGQWQKRFWAEKIPFFLIALASGIFTYSVMQDGGVMNSLTNKFSIWQKICFACCGIMMYVVKLLFPINLSAHYPYPPLNANNELPFLINFCPLILSGLAAAVYFFIRKNTVAVFGLLFYLISLAPVLQFVSNNDALIADHYSYLSYIGLFLIPAWALNALWTNEAENIKYLKIPGAVAMGMFLMLCAFLTFQQCKVWHDSLTLWNNALKCDPQNLRAYNSRGNAYLELGKNDKALADYNYAIKLNPEYAEAYFNRGLAYWAIGKAESAIIDFNTAIRLLPQFYLPYYNRGIIYQEEGKPEPAIADFDKAISLNPDEAQSYYSRGRAYSSEGKLDSAIRDFNTAIGLFPQFYLAYYNRGVAYAGKGETDLAMADFNATISLNPQYAQAYNNRGLTYANQGKPELAIANYDSAIALNPKLDLAYYNRGLVLATESKIQLAIADFNMAININPKYTHAYYGRGLAYWGEGKFEAAINDYNTAIGLDTTYAEAYDNRGVAYLSEGKIKQAIEDYNSAIRLDPKMQLAYFNRGNAYTNVGKPELAIPDFNMAISLNPKYIEAYLNRGAAYAAVSRIDLAIADFTTVISLKPNYAPAYNNRGILEEQKGDIVNARKDIEKAKELGALSR